MEKTKLLLACDLDNTLIFSKNKAKEGDICAEILNGNEQSFFTPKTLELTEKLAKEGIRLLPVTTRSSEQYRRIMWRKGFEPEYALVCNGGVLLKNGEDVPLWRERSEQAAAPYACELEKLCGKYGESGRFRTVRMIEGLYLFVGCEDEQAAAAAEKEFAADTALKIQRSGRKLYIFPPKMDKGTAVKKAAQLFGAEVTAAAGDSVMDIPMLEAADIALVPDEEMLRMVNNERKLCCGSERFSEFILEYALCIKNSI